MIVSIVHEFGPVTLVGGADASPRDLQKALTLAPTGVAADGGAASLLAVGADPAAVIGDFDSLSPADLAAIPPERLHRIEEQDSTDFEKALSRIEAPVVIGVGFTAGRLDHQLAVLHGMLALADRPCILLGGGEICFLVPPLIDIACVAGDVVSLFPLVPVCGVSDGLLWPIEGLNFAPGRRIGTSNSATGPVRLRMDGAGMLAILPDTRIDSVVRQFARPSGPRWPAGGI